MPNRVTAQQLADLVGVESLTGLEAFINDANLLVDEALLGKGYTFTDARLTMLEKYVAGHLWILSAEKGGLRSSQVERSIDAYVTPDSSNVGLRSSRFGQAAAGLDTTGLLVAAFEPARKAQFRLA